MSKNFTVASNDTPNLQLFFYKRGLTSIHKPAISHFEVNESQRKNPAFSIGFKEPVGNTRGIKVVAGRIVFEVLKGFPFQSLMAYLSANGDPTYSLTDLPAMDFACITKDGSDKYGEFIVKNIEFKDVVIKQGVNSPGRFLVADFIGSKLTRFAIPYFYNEFITDNYDNHRIRNDDEISEIKLDVVELKSVDSVYTESFEKTCQSYLLPGRTELGEDLVTSLDLKAKEFSEVEDGSAEMRVLEKEFANFIRYFYTHKNAYEESQLTRSTVVTYNDSDFSEEKQSSTAIMRGD